MVLPKRKNALHFSISKAMHLTTLKLNNSEIFVAFKVLIWVFTSVCQFQNLVSLFTYKTVHKEQGLCQVIVLFHIFRVQYCCTQLTSNSSHYSCPHLRYDVYFETSLLTFNTSIFLCS